MLRNLVINFKIYWKSEISIIDTAIFICGAIVAGEYFEKEVKEKAMLLFDAIDWNWYNNPKINQFYMGYSPERGFWGEWDMYAEQLMLYVLGASSRTHPIDISMYDKMQKPLGDYKDIKSIIYTYRKGKRWNNFSLWSSRINCVYSRRIH